MSLRLQSQVKAVMLQPPHASIDPNVTAAHIILALQSIASRNVDPLEAAVISVCALHSDIDTHNIIPQMTRMTGDGSSFKRFHPQPG